MVWIQGDNTREQGVIVDVGGYVITSYHAVRGSQAPVIEVKSGAFYEGKILCLNQAKDIAVMKMEGTVPALQALALGDSDLVQLYDDVTVVGYLPGSTGLSTSKGIITSFPKNQNACYLQTNAALDPGQAGSVVLNKAGGIIGIVSWNSGQAGREGWALSSNDISSILGQARETEADPLVTTSIEISSISNINAVISWKTNRPSSSQVEYGLETSYGSRTVEDIALLITHGAVVDGLQPKTSYHFRVRSVDCCGNETYSPDNVLTTMSSAFESGKLTISNVNVYNITSNAASVKWFTNKQTSTIVSYGTDRDSVLDTVTNDTPVYEHSLRLNGLVSETRYYVRIKSDNEYGESTQQELEPFSTLAQSAICCRINCRLPDFSFKTLQGADFTSADIKDHRVFMIFVKTNCSTCMQQAIYLNDIYQTWPKDSDVLLVAVVSSEKPADVIEWMHKYGLTIPVYIDVNSDLANVCKLRTIPSAFFLDAGLVINNFHSGGFASKKDMELALEQIK